MVRSEKSEPMQRKIRCGNLTDLAIPTWTLAREAIQAGRINDALNFVECAYSEQKAVHDIMVSVLEQALTYLARSSGEGELPKFFRQQLYEDVKKRVSVKQEAVDTLCINTEYQRSHFGNFTIVEETVRYMVRCDPCGSGGKLWRTRSVGTTKKAYPWSWSKKGVPYYCVHCCVANEILPVELRGYPIKIIVNGDRPEDPCVHLYYKKPELIPEEYFTRIGMTKTVK
jgi:hypothetical protein